ncbi:MAG: TlpA family protein disulfide reductase [Marinilabiliales bacterium]|nr:MAG: TlpA family protein disulfide reductase [Marinilabiliales bacterium]
MVISSCSTQEPDNRIVIAGKIEGLTEATVRLVTDAVLHETELRQDGTFHLEHTADDSRYYTVLSRPGDAFIVFLYPGDSLWVTYEASDLYGTFQATGSRAAEAEYLAEKSRITSGISNFNQLMVLDAQSYFDVKKPVIEELQELLNRVKAEEGISEELIELEALGLVSFDLYLDYMYPMVHRNRNNIPRNESIDFPEDETNERIAAFNFDDPLILKDRYSKQLLDIHIRDAVSEFMRNNPEAGTVDNAFISATFDVAGSKFSNPEVRDHVMFSALDRDMNYRGPARYRELYTRFLGESSTPAYKERVNNIIAEWEHISPGSEVPDFIFTDIEGNEVRLSDLSGKLIYIDVWATWCGPCIAEHPHWNTLMEEYEGKDVAFLAISTDNTREPWEKMVTEKNMQGYNWYAENAWESEISEHFNIRAIPRFLLLDRERRVIDPSAERPSGRIRETLDQHL